MSVWITVPSARPVDEVAKWAAVWRERGYNIALWRDETAPRLDCADFVYQLAGTYPGYALSVNALVAYILSKNADAEWFVAAGDDVFPDPNHTADEIAAQLTEHFGGTFGVMQPTGDRWGDRHGRAYIDHIAGSAWIGREFCKRVNQGKGPLWPEFQHMFVDQWLQEFAVKLGVFWQRPDLTQIHQHWARPREGERIGLSSRKPEFALKAEKTWNAGKAELQRLRGTNFKECMPL